MAKNPRPATKTQATKKPATSNAARQSAKTSGPRVSKESAYEVEDDLVDRIVRGPEDTDRAYAQSRIVETGLDRAYLRKRIIKEIQQRVDGKSREWGTRGWLLGSLGRIVGDDSEAGKVLMKHMNPSFEPEPFVRHWTLEGLWYGDPPSRDPYVERGRKDEPLVALLADAMLAHDGDPAATERLERALASPETQECWAALRALRVVRLPRFREQVRAIEAKPKDKTLLWNAKKALELMGGSGAAFEALIESGPQVQSKAPSVPSSVKNAVLTGTGDGFLDAPAPDVWIIAYSTELDAHPKSLIGHEFEHKIPRSDQGEHLQEIERGDHLLVAVMAPGEPRLVGWGSVSGRIERGLKAVWRGAWESPVNLADIREALPGLAYSKDPPPSFIPVDRREWTVIRELIAHRSGTSPMDLPNVLPEPFFGVEVMAVEHVPATIPLGGEFRAHIQLRNTGGATWPLGAPIEVEGRLEEIGLTPKAIQSWKRSLVESVPPGASATLALSMTTPPVTGTYSAVYAVTAAVWGGLRSQSGPIALSVVDASVEPSTIRDTPAQQQSVSSKGWIPDAESSNIGPMPTEPQVQQAGQPVESPAIREVMADVPAVLAAAPAAPPVATSVYIIRELYSPPEEASRVVLSVSEEIATIDFRGRSYESYVTPDFATLQNELTQLEPMPLHYGTKLFGAVINNNVRRPSDGSTEFGYRKAMEETGGKLAVELKLDSDDLLGLSWERITETLESPPLATKESAPFYRRVGNAEVEAASPPLKILVAICNPPGLAKLADKLKRDLPALNVAEECEFFARGLARLREDGLAEYEILGQDASQPVTLQQITERLQEGPHILHLLAHGLFINNEYCLAIHRDEVKLPVVKAADLALPLANWKVRLAILEACHSGQVPADEKCGPALGTQLVRAGLPAVISMQEKLGIKSAQYFNHRFYHHLARSGRVEMALAATRHDLRTWGRDEPRSWSIPVLHLGAATGALFEIDENRAARLSDERPRVLGREELDRRGHGIDRKIKEALGAATGTLDTAQITALSQAMTAGLAPQATAERAGPLALPQNREALQKWMDRPVDLRGADLASYVLEATGLRYPLNFYFQTASALNAGKHVVFIGPPGTGKTTVAHAICDFAAKEHFCRGKIPTTASADWTTFDTVGGYVPTSGDRLEFRPGLFLQAITTGRWLVLDEINRAEIDKAVGELFTVLSGQRVDLPYRVEGQPVRILPYAEAHPDKWIPSEATGDYDYVVHPSWRTLATMNVYDRSSLFGMSFAFMRRFAFVDVGVPDEKEIFAPLRSHWVDQGVAEFRRGVITDEAGNEIDPVDGVKQRLATVFEVGSPLMLYRELGPAIAKDMIRYAIDRARQEQRPDLVSLVAEAFLLYAVPQLDGLTREAITDVYRHLAQLFPDGAGSSVRSRIRALYPHVSRGEWPDAAQATAEREGGGDV